MFLYKLAMVAMLLPSDISAIESKHASVRRLLVSASVQTHAPEFESLAAGWGCMAFRNNRSSSWAPWQRKKQRKGLAKKKGMGQRQEGGG